MTDFVTSQSQPFGSVPQIPNPLATAELNTAVLYDPVKIKAYKDSIADALNTQSAGPKFRDLSDRIADVVIETSAQGASILTVSLIDPMWVLPLSGFIGVDEQGYLWPPIDVNFPTGTDCVWRLCQYRATWDKDFDPTQGNIVLTFEDRIASLLRQMSPATPGGLSQGQPNQTLGGFFKQLVDNANSVLKLNKTEQIRLVELISPADPNYTPPINNLPSSAQSTLRKNPIKQDKGLTAAQQKQLAQIQEAVAEIFGPDNSQEIANLERHAGWYSAGANNVDPIAGSVAPSAGVPGLGVGR